MILTINISEIWKKNLKNSLRCTVPWFLEVHYNLIILPSFENCEQREGLLNVGEHVVHKLVIFHADNDIIKKSIFVLGKKKFREVGFRNEATKTSHPFSLTHCVTILRKMTSKVLVPRGIFTWKLTIRILKVVSLQKTSFVRQNSAPNRLKMD